MFTEHEKKIIKSICYSSKGNSNPSSIKIEKWFDKELYNKVNSLPLNNFRKKIQFALDDCNIEKYYSFYICKDVDELISFIKKLSPGLKKKFYDNHSNEIAKIEDFNGVDISFLNNKDKSWFIHHNLTKIPKCEQCDDSLELNKNIKRFCSQKCQNTFLNRKREYKKSSLTDDEIREIISSVLPDNRNPNHNEKISSHYLNILEWYKKSNLSNLSSKEIIYHYLNNIEKVPKCLCGESLAF